MKKILFLNFVCHWCTHYETELDLMLDFINEGHDIYSVSCNKIFDKYCIMNPNHDADYCSQCCATYKEGLKLIKLPKKNVLKFSKVKCPEFPVFNNQDELSAFSVDGINIGFGVCTSYMSIVRDYLFNPTEHKEEINNYLKTAYIVKKNVEKILNKLKPDEVYIFNGRFSECWPVLGLCKKYGIDYYIHDRGSTLKKYHVVKNDILHRPKRYQDEIDFYWNNADESNKNEIAKKWFYDRRNGVEQNWIAFTKDQQKGLLPKNFDKSKENIAVFNSSLDEYHAFLEWKNPIDKDENKVLKGILEHYKNDNSKHFYLRIHPNLNNVNTTQMVELKEIEKQNYSNLTIIWADEIVDTYALIENCDKTLTFSSTVGVEAAFWGKPSIVAGISIYSHLDCCYCSTNYEELFDLIDSSLVAKKDGNAYPYGYWLASFGKEYTTFKPTGISEGEFLGKNIQNLKETFPHKIIRKVIREIKYPFKKILNKLNGEAVRS